MYSDSSRCAQHSHHGQITAPQQTQALHTNFADAPAAAPNIPSNHTVSKKAAINRLAAKSPTHTPENRALHTLRQHRQRTPAKHQLRVLRTEDIFIPVEGVMTYSVNIFNRKYAQTTKQQAIYPISLPFRNTLTFTHYITGLPT